MEFEPGYRANREPLLYEQWRWVRRDLFNLRRIINVEIDKSTFTLDSYGSIQSARVPRNPTYLSK